ncbi:acyl carrier protein [Methylomonas rivi]|uniref:Acyl carrier protein n=1 Tax=Methylomonas rivi TaxID=2952226 RepID=A0ABT1U4J6_9GAMM|nr:acyl carrier protein [Methylomonas sp. WSC-6]
MELLNQVKAILYRVLGIDETRQVLLNNTLLLGAIPEFDSMAVVTIITTLEEQFGFTVDDDEIDASVFETVDTLVAFVERKLNAI